MKLTGAFALTLARKAMNLSLERSAQTMHLSTYQRDRDIDWIADPGRGLYRKQAGCRRQKDLVFCQNCDHRMQIGLG
jgi:hypothetical protein